MRKVEDAEYLYQQGDSFVVRMQVPARLRKAVGRYELKKALGTELGAAKRERHKVIADFQRIIEAATRAEAPAAGAIVSVNENAIDAAVHKHFSAMVVHMQGTTLLPDNPVGHTRLGRIEGLRQHIEMMLDSIDRSDYGAVGFNAEWLIEQYGWALTPRDDLFAYLCERVMRARLEAYRNELRRLEGNFAIPADKDPLFGPAPPKARAAVATLGALIDRFNADREGDWAVSTKKNYAIITRVLEELCGRDTPLTEIDRDFCRSVRDVLKRLPSNYQKKALTRGRPLAEVVEIAAREALPLLQPATINMHLDKLGAIVRFGRDEGLILGNPMKDIEIDDPVDASDKRDPFSIGQLKQIFGLMPWASRAENPEQRPSRYWVPLIALYTGARLGEICALTVHEIAERNGTAVFEIRNREDRRVKNGKSRVIPVHSALIYLGLLDFVKQQRAAGHEQLFPEEKPNKLGIWGDAVSDWFIRTIAPLKLRGRKLTMHSFRHAFEDALREVDLHDTPIGNALMGRSSGGVSKNYGSGFSTAKLKEAVERVSYPGLSLFGPISNLEVHT